MAPRAKPSHRLRRNGPTLAGKDHMEVARDTGVHYQTCYRIMTYRGIASFIFVDAVKAAYGGRYDDIVESCPAGQELVPDIRHDVVDPKPHKPMMGRPKGAKRSLGEPVEENPPARDDELDPKPPELPAEPVKSAKAPKRQPWDKRKASKDLEPNNDGAEWHWWEYRQILFGGKPMSEKRAKRAAYERALAENLESGDFWSESQVALRMDEIREALVAAQPVPVYVGPPLFSSK